MSISSQAIITTARKLITGATWAADNVDESPIDPIANFIESASGDAPKPYIAIYIERMTSKPDGQHSMAEMKVYIYLPSNKMTLPDGEVFEPTRQYSGMTLNIIARQVENALCVTVDKWSEVWRRLVLEITERDYRPLLLEIENGVRVPAMEISFSLIVLPEPVIGCPLSATYRMFDEALRSTGSGVVADIFKAAIENPAGLETYEQAAMQLHMTEQGLITIGVAPIGAILADVDYIPPLEPVDD